LKTLFLLDATNAALGLYQLIFVCAVLLSLYSSYTWYEGRRDKEPLTERRGLILFLLAVITMIATSFVSYLITGSLPF
jgi:uncharacterized membrane protein